MKIKIINLIIGLIIIASLIIVISNIVTKKEISTQTAQVKKYENIRTDNSELTQNKKINMSEKHRDTTVILYFKDLSNVYNYKIIDKYLNYSGHNHYATIIRVIKIFNENDSLVQKVYPHLTMGPWYGLEDSELKLSRSYITGKNANYDDMDNYCGEIVVADLNFDGLEDFATPINTGVDNGPHYEFYIQNKNHRFEYNIYLTENLIWFPENINDSLMTFTSSVPRTVYGTFYQTFKYDSISTKWKKIKNYTIDNRIGKLMK